MRHLFRRLRVRFVPAAAVWAAIGGGHGQADCPFCGGFDRERDLYAGRFGDDP